tara:strand:- start:5073 stop:5432 length:360 start_codon:yes stop_codon:yes gene_type:complete
MNLLPDDIIREHIMPYTYIPISREQIADIHSYNRDYNELTNYYFPQYNDVILLNDLEQFVENHRPIFDNYTRVCRKTNHLFIKKHTNTTNKCRLVWGELTPRERAHFFNVFVLENEPDD